jgi:histidinol-phosphate phosphatase family protein
VTIVFLDRDGVINENKPNGYVASWEEFAFIPGAKEALRRLAENDDVRIFVVSNQAGIGKGVVSAAQVEAVNRRMKREIEAAGGRIDGILYCPHTAEDRCADRKPEAGLLLRALSKAREDAQNRFIVGDAMSDMVAGKKVSAIAIMVKTGRGQDELKSIRDDDSLKPDYIAEDISEAAEIILQRLRQ